MKYVEKNWYKLKSQKHLISRLTFFEFFEIFYGFYKFNRKHEIHVDYVEHNNFEMRLYDQQDIEISYPMSIMDSNSQSESDDDGIYFANEHGKKLG